MAPKRRRAQDLEAVTESTRATRSSTRNEGHLEPATPKKGAPQTSRKSTASKQVENEVDDELAPMAKKTRTKAKATKTSQKNSARNDDEARRQCTPNNDEAGPSASPSVPVASKKIPALSKKETQSPDESYSPARALALFQQYADPDDRDVIGPEGFTQLCTDAQISMDGALPLILAWQLGADEMAKFTRNQWVTGTTLLQISSLIQLAIAVTDLESLLILDEEPLKPPPATPTKKKRTSMDNEPYNKTLYRAYVSNKKDAFSKFYLFCFALAKSQEARNIDMETATAFWSVLLAPRYKIIRDVVEYINEKGTYKGVNKDLWNMMLEFCQTVNPTLEDYEADGAWPTLLDDFVSWKKSKMGDGDTGVGATNGEK